MPNPANKAPWKRRKEYQEAVNKLEKEKSGYIENEEIFANLTINPDVTLEIERLQKEREQTLKNILDQIQSLYCKKLSSHKASLTNSISNHKIFEMLRCSNNS